MREIGLFLVKPDALLLGELSVAKARIKEAGLTISQEAEVTFSPQSVQEFYKDKQDGLSQYWEGYLTAMPSVALIVIGEAVSQRLMAVRDELRAEYQHDGFYTGTHCSDSEENARREIEILERKAK